MFTILKKESFSSSVKLFEIEAPRLARKIQPGQFIMLRVHERGERIPLTVADYNPERGSVTVVFVEVGKSTRQLGSLEAGGQILDVVGPLGKPTEIKKLGRVVCVGGGYGSAAIYPMCRSFKEVGNEVIAILGTRTKTFLFWEDRLRGVTDELLLPDEQNDVHELVRQVAAREDRPDRVVAIGPVPLLRGVAEVTKNFGIKTIVSLNPIMVDGTGMCGACRVSVSGDTKFACVDGPEFDGHEVDFAELAQRRQVYREQERDALARLQKGCDCR